MSSSPSPSPRPQSQSDKSQSPSRSNSPLSQRSQSPEPAEATESQTTFPAPNSPQIEDESYQNHQDSVNSPLIEGDDEINTTSEDEDENENLSAADLSDSSELPDSSDSNSQSQSHAHSPDPINQTQKDDQAIILGNQLAISLQENQLLTTKYQNILQHVQDLETQNQSLKNNLSIQESMTEPLKAKTERLEQENLLLSQRANQIAETLSEKDKQLLTLEKTFSQKNILQTSKITLQETEIKHLKKQLELKSDNSSSYFSQLEKAKLELSSCKSQSESTITDLQYQLQSSSELVAVYKTQIVDLESSNTQFSKQIDTLSNNLLEKEQVISNIKQQLQELQEKSNIPPSEYQKRAMEYKQQLDAKHDLLETACRASDKFLSSMLPNYTSPKHVVSLLDNISQFHSAIDSSLNQFSTLKKSHAALSIQRNQLKQRISSLENENRQTLKQLYKIVSESYSTNPLTPFKNSGGDDQWTYSNLEQLVTKYQQLVSYLNQERQQKQQLFVDYQSELNKQKRLLGEKITLLTQKLEEQKESFKNSTKNDSVVSQLQNQLSTMNMQFEQQMNQSVSAHKLEKSEYLVKISQLSSQVQNLNIQLASLKAQSEFHKNQYTLIQQKSQDLETQNHTLSSQLESSKIHQNSLQAQYENASQSLSTVTKEKISLSTINSRLQQEVALLHSRNKQLETESQGLRQQTNSLNQVVSSFQSLQSSLKEKIDSVDKTETNEKLVLQNQLDASDQRFIQEQQKFQQLFAKYTAAQEKLEAIPSQAEHISILEKHVSDLTSEKRDLKVKLTEQITALQKKLTNQEEMFAVMKAQHEKTTKVISIFEQNSSNKSTLANISQLETLLQIISTNQRDNTRLYEKYETALAETRFAQGRIQRLEAQISTLKANLAQNMATSGTIMDQPDPKAAQDRANSITLKSISLQAEIDSLKDSNERLRLRLKTLVSQIERVQSQNKTQEFEKLEKLHNQLTIKHSALQSDFDESVQEYTSLEKEHLSLQQQYKNLTSQKESFEKKYNETVEALALLQSKHQVNNESLASIEEKHQERYSLLEKRFLKARQTLKDFSDKATVLHANHVALQEKYDLLKKSSMSLHPDVNDEEDEDAEEDEEDEVDDGTEDEVDEEDEEDEDAEDEVDESNHTEETDANQPIDREETGDLEHDEQDHQDLEPENHDEQEETDHEPEQDLEHDTEEEPDQKENDLISPPPAKRKKGNLHQVIVPANEEEEDEDEQPEKNESEDSEQNTFNEGEKTSNDALGEEAEGEDEKNIESPQVGASLTKPVPHQSSPGPEDVSSNSNNTHPRHPKKKNQKSDSSKIHTKPQTKKSNKRSHIVSARQKRPRSPEKSVKTPPPTQRRSKRHPKKTNADDLLAQLKKSRKKS